MTPAGENGTLRSSLWFGPRDVGGLIHRAYLRSEGLSPESFVGRPIIGICNSWSELVNCNLHFRGLAAAVKRGVLQAGGFPLEFPTMSLGEDLMKPTAMLNPELLSASNDTETGWEGCLSVPGIRGLVRRNRQVRVRYLTREGDICEEEYEGFLARIFQHEFDHINGVVFLDRVEDSHELVTEKEYLRIVS